MKKLLELELYNKGLTAEKEQNYSKAIEFYLLATLEGKEYTFKIYYHLALVFEKKSSYQEACDAFLLMDNKKFKKKNVNSSENQKNQIVLQQYLLNNKMLTSEDWLRFSKKAETLMCWSVASYGYSELISRSEKFNKSYYFFLAYSLMQEERYKEAFTVFYESIVHESCYVKELAIEEKVILYEGDKSISDKVYKLYQEIDKDAYFDAYKHVWILDNKDASMYQLNRVNSIVVLKNSDLHKRYLAKAQYIISNKEYIENFVRREEQFYIFTENKNIPSDATHVMEDDISTFNFIQEVFFGNKLVVYSFELGENELSLLYKEAVFDFENENWESSYEKFLRIDRDSRDIQNLFPVEYYLCESKFRIDIESKELEELLVYRQYKLSAEQFVGIDYLLERASSLSLQNSKEWKELQNSFLNILEDIKENRTKDMRSIADITFLEKIVTLEKYFVKELESEFLPYQVWFLFSHLFIFARRYRTYEFTRTKALESVLVSKKTNMSEELRYKINAMSEIEKREEYDVLREALLLNRDTSYIKKHLQFLGASQLYFNRASSAVDFYKKFYTKEEEEFSKYIQYKSIAVVGPLKSNLNLGEEIDRHDVVVRFNYRGLNESLKESHGVKTNISFYISEILIKDRINAQEIEYMNELDWIVFDTAHTKDSVCFSGVYTKMRPRYYVAHRYANPYFKGTSNGIQRVLLDLLRFNVGKITVYNTNLFLENTYEKDYKSRGSLGADHFNFIWHDPLSNFIFLKRLKGFGIIDADEILANILEMSKDDYIDALEERYGTK